MDSLKQRLGKIARRFGELAMTDLEKPGPIEDFKADLIEDGRANATVNRYLAQLRHMTNWAIGRGYMKKSPFYHKLKNPSGVKLLKGENQRKRRLAEGEEELLLHAADKLCQGNKVDHEYVARVMRARIEIALDFGLRRGEMLKIKNRDIDWHAKPDPILIIQWGNAKSRRERKIALVSPRVVTWLRGATARRRPRWSSLWRRARRRDRGLQERLGVGAGTGRHHDPEEEGRGSQLARSTARMREPPRGTRRGRAEGAGAAGALQHHHDPALLQHQHRTPSGRR